jgi:quinol monooxygenase YgiN
MTMACTVLLEVKANPGMGNDLLATFKAILPDTRGYDGCTGVVTYQDQDDADVIVLVEQWESKAKYEKYLGWRQETGALETLGSKVAGPPSIRYFNETDA